MVNNKMTIINAAIFDYGFTLVSEHYFNRVHLRIPRWHEIIQEAIFADRTVSDDWMRGKIGLRDIADILREWTGEDSDSLLACLKDGCRNLRENLGVIKFARRLKADSVPIALVTGNFDVFNEVVVPAHGYDKLFDVIINSCDYGETDKRALWPLAFARLGGHIGYHNSLLIEDTENELRMFREAGGHAIKYVDDITFETDAGRFSFISKGGRCHTGTDDGENGNGYPSRLEGSKNASARQSTSC